MAKRLHLSGAPREVVIDAELTLTVAPFGMADFRRFAGPLAELGVRAPAEGDDPGAVAADLEAFDTAFGTVLDLVQEFVTAWTVEDLAGRPVPVSRAAAEALILSEPALAGALLAAILGPAFTRAQDAAAEGNGCAPSPAGTSAGAPNTAATAPASVPSAPRG